MKHGYWENKKLRGKASEGHREEDESVREGEIEMEGEREWVKEEERGGEQQDQRKVPGRRDRGEREREGGRGTRREREREGEREARDHSTICQCL